MEMKTKQDNTDGSYPNNCRYHKVNNLAQTGFQEEYSLQMYRLLIKKNKAPAHGEN